MPSQVPAHQYWLSFGSYLPPCLFFELLSISYVTALLRDLVLLVRIPQSLRSGAYWVACPIGILEQSYLAIPELYPLLPMFPLCIEQSTEMRVVHLHLNYL